MRQLTLTILYHRTWDQIRHKKRAYVTHEEHIKFRVPSSFSGQKSNKVVVI